MEDVQTPTPRNLAQESAESIRTQVNLAPDIYAARAKYDPLYANLALKNLGTTLSGSNGEDGLLDIYDRTSGRMSDMTARANTASRAADISDVATLSPAAMAAIRASNPAQTKLLDTLTTQAQDELDRGAELDPSMLREVAQATRAGQAARGMGFGTRDLAEEIFSTGTAAQTLRDKRRMFAQTVLRDNQGAYGDPFAAILGRSSGNTGATMSAAGEGRSIYTGSGAPLFNTGVNVNDVFSSNYNGAYTSAMANANNSAALLGGGMSMLGNLGGSGIMAGAR